MGRRLPSELAIALRPRAAANPAYRQLYAALRAAMLDGRLRPGARLPSTRDLARRAAVARGTVVTAIEHLKAEGYLVGRLGSGTYVADVLPDSLLVLAPRTASALPASLKIAAKTAPKMKAARRVRRVSEVAMRAQSFAPSVVPNAPAFRANQPALDLFPTALWAQVAGRRLRRVSAGLLKGCPPMGHPPLQRALADYLGASRGVVCDPAQIAIVAGVQEAVDLVAHVILNPGDRVCVEDPGYPGAVRALQAMGMAITHVPLDAEGMRVPTRDRGVKLAYVTPGHQFPTGTTMSLARRFALLEWARGQDALIFEDDYDSEYRFIGSPVPAMQGLDRHGSVLFAGSFSKVLFPSLRLGYLVVPPDLVEPVTTLKSLTNRHAPLIDQAILCDFITEGHFSRHVRRMREVYAERLAALVHASAGQLDTFVEISPVEAGLQTTATFRAPLDGAMITAQAEARGVEVVPVSRYSKRPLRRDGLILGFAAVDPTELTRGVRELTTVLHQASKKSGVRATSSPMKSSAGSHSGR